MDAKCVEIRMRAHGEARSRFLTFWPLMELDRLCDEVDDLQMSHYQRDGDNWYYELVVDDV